MKVELEGEEVVEMILRMRRRISNPPILQTPPATQPLGKSSPLTKQVQFPNLYSMSRPFPYTFISCPCADTPVPGPARKHISRGRESPQKLSHDQPAATDEDEEEEKTFDPRSPRSNFSLYPIEQLLYCEDCHQIKCPRCITEEIVSWYCPNCLFETPSSTVRSEENRYVDVIRVYYRQARQLTRIADARGIASIVQYAPRLWQSQRSRVGVSSPRWCSPVHTVCGLRWI